MPAKPPVSLITGYVQDRNHILVLLRYDELEERGAENTNARRWDRRTNSWANFPVLWSATRLWADPSGLPIILTGPAGKVAIKAKPVVPPDEEDIWPGRGGPALLGDIRDLRLIGQHLYVAGMGRQVYRREGAGRWVRADAGMVVTQPDPAQIHGFNSLDGPSETDIYAAGFDGEMWRSDGRRWRQLEKLTNLLLNRVRTVAPDQILICGKQGVLLRGHLDAWSVVDHQSTEDELWDVETFNGEVYIATSKRVYRLTAADDLEEVDLGVRGKPTCGSLHANDGVLISVGRKCLCWTEDGRKWHDITP
jgi:hypothetical protein